MNCIEKSKIDWSNHTKEEKIEEQLEQNRKDGYLAKRRFLDQVAEKEYEHKKAVEKHQLASRK